MQIALVSQETHALIEAYSPIEILLQDVKRNDSRRLLTRMLRDQYNDSGHTKVVAVSQCVAMRIIEKRPVILILLSHAGHTLIQTKAQLC